MRRLKRAIDPQDIMNPGKILVGRLSWQSDSRPASGRELDGNRVSRSLAVSAR